LPKQIKSVLELDAKLRELAEIIHNNTSLLIMGRGYQ